MSVGYRALALSIGSTIGSRAGGLVIIADRTDVDLYTETVAVLTRAALQSNTDGTHCDFSDFLARSLAATAANVGGPDRLIAGRPGSWESSCVDGLVRGTAGNDPGDWIWFRTQPIVVRLNVAELIEDGLHHPGLMGLDEALEVIGRRYESAATEQDLDAWDSEIDMVTDRYMTEYRLYAARFTTSARQIATCIPALSADVHVEADTNPNSTWWSTAATTTNPSEVDSDPLALRIWCSAHDVTPLPNVDLWLDAGLRAGSNPVAVSQNGFPSVHATADFLSEGTR